MKKNDEITNNKISLKEYFDNRFDELKNYINIKFDSTDKANCLAQETLNARLENMNEFRNSLKDQTAKYITRTEHDALITKIDADLKYIVSQIKNDMLQEQTRTRWVVAEIVIVFSIVVSVVSIIINYFKI